MLTLNLAFALGFRKFIIGKHFTVKRMRSRFRLNPDFHGNGGGTLETG